MAPMGEHSQPGTTAARGLALAWLLCACDPPPTPLPAQQVAEAAPDRPSAAQILFAAPLLPADRLPQQRVRMLVWLRWMDLDAGQRARLAELRRLATGWRQRIAGAEAELSARLGPEEDAIYEELWGGLARGGSLADPSMQALLEKLDEFNRGGERERSLLALRLEGIRAVLEAERPLLDTLSPAQEARLADSLFLLRHRLDPIGDPGDFEALVGAPYQAGDVAVLARGALRDASQPWDIGGLWSDAAAADPKRAEALPEARRELLLYLLLLEPGLEEALAAVHGAG